MSTVIVSGSFDNLRSRHVRFLEESARLGPLHLLLWSDRLVTSLAGSPPKFTQEERRYFVEAVRYVNQVTLIDDLTSADSLPPSLIQPETIWSVTSDLDNSAKRAFCQTNGLDYRVIADQTLEHFPSPTQSGIEQPTGQKKVLVTGCYDWLHTGHVRFFEEVSQLGDLYVVVGNDANVEHLKGKGHPMFRETERHYMVQAIRYVKQALVSSGWGWMDAAPEIEQIRPEIFAVNEDGDKPEKRAFCDAHQLEYAVLKRAPKEGLPRRESTHLRGF